MLDIYLTIIADGPLWGISTLFQIKSSSRALLKYVYFQLEVPHGRSRKSGMCGIKIVQNFSFMIKFDGARFPFNATRNASE